MAAQNAWRITVGVILALAWCAWIVVLASLSVAQNKCTEPNPAHDDAVDNYAILNGFSYTNDCSKVLRFWWFVLWFEFVALLVFSVFMAFPGLLQRSAFSWLSIWTVLGLLWILASDAWLSTQQTNYFTQGVAQSYARGATAGSIMEATFTLMLAILMGWRQKRRDAGAGPIKY